MGLEKCRILAKRIVKYWTGGKQGVSKSTLDVGQKDRRILDRNSNIGNREVRKSERYMTE
jgi:hypothetical protein